MAAAPQQPSGFPFPISRAGPTPVHLITTAGALRLGDFLRRRFAGHHHHLGLLIHSSCKNIFHLDLVPQLKELWLERALQLQGVNFQSSYDACESAWVSGLCFFNGEEGGYNYGVKRNTNLDTSRSVSSSGRRWTNIFIAANVLVYLAQIATHGKLMLWGAKINGLIDKGQLWRLVTSSFLHANIGHLMMNCYSLNSVGPTMENISGPERFVAIYITSAIASSTMSYWLCKAPAVGASGAIFGLVSFLYDWNNNSDCLSFRIIKMGGKTAYCGIDLMTTFIESLYVGGISKVGSFAVFLLRHGSLVRGGTGGLQHIARIITLNMVLKAIGLLSGGIDNWGHLGGLLGGVATSWLLGPEWRSDSRSFGRRGDFVDRAPIFSLISTRRAP
ncbi:hypothetical protein RJ639_016572 [Escallonia herrerae]|uniref:Peptidase S54 rhomboid domain-containing protein n=1 Tax=Escallonia herrerae TaxID=1293975 RepID=A0AA89AK27_9ASTE|nr:hypothetical protein RJ639_016572 [Escallonia herrerae]